MNFLDQGFRQLEQYRQTDRHTNRQTDPETDATERNTMPHCRWYTIDQSIDQFNLRTTVPKNANKTKLTQLYSLHSIMVGLSIVSVVPREYHGLYHGYHGCTWPPLPGAPDQLAKFLPRCVDV